MKSYQKKENKVKESIAILDQEKLLDTAAGRNPNRPPAGASSIAAPVRKRQVSG